MSEICFDCLNKIYGGTKKPEQYIISDDYDLCEECGEWKRVIVAERKSYYLYKVRFFVYPFIIIWKILCVLYRLALAPYTIIKYIKEKYANKMNNY